ncbi:MAG TPA: DNA polymerase III subunit delta [Planctomycetota bacterium]|nr:DNA polymerase III subunit delta [Planctomycetota bacterium]
MAKRASTTDDAKPKKAGDWTAKTLPRLILIIGPENVLREEALAKVKKAAFGEGDGGMNWVVMHGPVNKNEAEALTPAAFLDEACTGSMFAAEDEIKVVVVRQADVYLSDKEIRPILERGQERIPETSTLVLEAANPTNLKTTNFYKNLEKSGAVILCESLTDRWGNTQELELEIEKRTRERKLKLAPGAMNALLERCARNLGVMDEELDKLALALGSKTAAETIPVTEQDVAEFCASTRTFSAFNFADAVVDRDLKHALEILGAIFDRGIADSSKPGKIITNDGAIAMLLLGALTWRVTQLQDFQNMLDNGMNEFKAFGEMKVFGPRQEAFKRTMRKHNTQTLRRCVEALYRANLDLRQGGSRAQEVLETMVWTMVGK